MIKGLLAFLLALWPAATAAEPMHLSLQRATELALEQKEGDQQRRH